MHARLKIVAMLVSVMAVATLQAANEMTANKEAVKTALNKETADEKVVAAALIGAESVVNVVQVRVETTSDDPRWAPDPWRRKRSHSYPSMVVLHSGMSPSKYYTATLLTFSWLLAVGTAESPLPADGDDQWKNTSAVAGVLELPPPDEAHQQVRQVKNTTTLKPVHRTTLMLVRVESPFVLELGYVETAPILLVPQWRDNHRELCMALSWREIDGEDKGAFYRMLFYIKKAKACGFSKDDSLLLCAEAYAARWLCKADPGAAFVACQDGVVAVYASFSQTKPACDEPRARRQAVPLLSLGSLRSAILNSSCGEHDAVRIQPLVESSSLGRPERVCTDTALLGATLAAAVVIAL